MMDEKIETFQHPIKELTHLSILHTAGKLIRQRYRRAAELSKVRGKLSCLLINDIDAGIGHFQNTQITVGTMIPSLPKPLRPWQ